ncbi:putative ATP-dependent RNA helicase dhr2 [Geranomyces variabilis]|nr:putative ATP-dependent RNA helicase dhr2 [Geranomyces variabilis]
MVESAVTGVPAVAGTSEFPAARPRFAPINPNDGGSSSSKDPTLGKRRHSQTLDLPQAANLKRSLKKQRKKERKAALTQEAVGDAGVDSAPESNAAFEVVAEKDLGLPMSPVNASVLPGEPPASAAADLVTARRSSLTGQAEAHSKEGKGSEPKFRHLIEGNVKKDLITAQVDKKAKRAKLPSKPVKKVVNFSENGEQTVTTDAPPKHPNSKAALNAKKASLQAQREALPCYEARQALVDAIMANRTTVIVGETGSGKTTQIPQFLHDAGLTKNGMIAITQPRRVAALLIAKRVAEEMGTRLGDKVGYSIRFDDTTAATTKIKYMTDGMLLRELLSDRKLSKYSVIILDEAHERTLRTDVLFGMVKGIQRERQDLKIIVMSATLNAERFSEYFDGAEILYVQGRQFPVRTFVPASQLEDYVDAALVTTFQLHQEQPKGDFLVFLTGQEEIDNLQKLMEEQARDLPPNCPKLLVCPIYAKLPTDQQTRVFEPAPPGTRKVILSTNVAETSITISGIRYVIDTGVSKVRSFNAKTGMESLTVQPISKASAQQRAGRAGREAAGFCYRLYPEPAYRSLRDETEPEIMRCNLAAVVLMLKASGVEDAVGFDYMDKPARTSIVRALEQLYALGALSDDGTLSPLGQKMAELPLDPVYSKVLLQSVTYKCTKEVLTIIAMLSVDLIFYSPPDKREQAGAAKKRFMNYDGDHLTLLNVYQSYQTVAGDPSWCADNFVSARSLKQVADIRKQLVAFTARQGIDANVSCGTDNYEAVLKCFLSGCFQNVAMRTPDGSYKTLVGNQAVYIHPSSVLFLKKPDAVVYNELMHTSKQYMRNISIIYPPWLLDVAPQYYGRAAARSTV